MCKATSSNNSISSHPLREQSEINKEDKTTTMIVTSNDISLDESLDDSITCQWVQAEDDNKTESSDKPATNPEEQDGNFIFRAFNSLASLPGRNRASSEDSLPVIDGDDDEHDECAKEEAEDEITSDLPHQQQQQEGSIITRIISRQPVTSLDTAASKCVLRCLEENMENQSMLYKWATSNMTPTVHYMGRKFQPIYDNNDENNSPQVSLPSAPSKENIPRASSTASSTTTVGTTTTTTVDDQNNMSFVARMGLSWSSTHSETDEMDLEREECKDYMRDLAHNQADFATFKAELRRQGVKTNLCLDLLYKVAKKTTQDNEEPQRRRCNSSSESMASSSSLAGDDQSPWTYHRMSHHHVDDEDMDQVNTAAGEEFVGYADDDEDAPSTLIIISRCE